jgi:hypothetical protein
MEEGTYAILLQRAAVGRIYQDNCDTALRVTEQDFAPGTPALIAFPRDERLMQLCAVLRDSGQAWPVVTPSRELPVAPTWRRLDPCVLQMVPSGVEGMEVVLPFECTLDPGAGSVHLLIVTKQGLQEGTAGPGSAVPAMPIGLSAVQQVQSGAGGYLCLPSATVLDKSSGEHLSLDAATHVDLVVDTVLWSAGTVGRLNFGLCRLHVTPELTSAVMCGAVGHLHDGFCALQLGTMHVGRLAQVEGRVTFLADP